MRKEGRLPGAEEVARGRSGRNALVTREHLGREELEG